MIQIGFDKEIGIALYGQQVVPSEALVLLHALLKDAAQLIPGQADEAVILMRRFSSMGR